MRTIETSHLLLLHLEELVRGEFSTFWLAGKRFSPPKQRRGCRAWMWMRRVHRLPKALDT